MTITTIDPALAEALLAWRKAKRKLKKADTAQSRASKAYIKTDYNRHSPEGRRYREAQADYQKVRREADIIENKLVAQIEALYGDLLDEDLKQIAKGQPQ